MNGAGSDSHAALGRRIAQARGDAGMTQAELAGAVGLERTALVRVESGERKVSAAELLEIAAKLDVPVGWFAADSPPSVVSRRRDPAVGGVSRALDRALDFAARDVEFLYARGILPGSDRGTRKAPESYADAENLARSVRADLGLADGPVPDLQAAAEQAGLLGFSFALGPDSVDAGCVAVRDLGVAVVNGSTDPGRRRFSLAHELGHHLTGDAYEPSPRLGASDSERMLNAFAAYLLMPRPAVLAVWGEFTGQPVRRAATAVAVRFSVSWTAACNQLRNLGLIDAREREVLVTAELRRGELFEFGERYVIELVPPSVPPGYAQAVVGAYRSNRLAPAKTVDLLHGTVTEADLPEPDAPTLDDLLSEFETDT